MKIYQMLLGVALGSAVSNGVAGGHLSAIAAQYLGREYPLSPSQVDRLQSLAFPQSEAAMSFLGIPKYTSRNSDWYPTAWGELVRVDYGQGRAVGISWEVRR